MVKNILFVFPINEGGCLGIEYLSAVLKKEGHNVDLILDLINEKDFKKRLVKRIESFKPDFICFSVMTDIYAWACDVAKFVRKITDASIVFGGIHVTSCPEEVISNEFVDYIVIGEGEGALKELVLDKADTEIKNVWTKVIRNSIRPLIQDLDFLPYPNKELFIKEAPHYQEVYRCLTSRGCPFVCSYCFNSYMMNLYKGDKWLRQRSVENVINELKWMKKKGLCKQIFFVDDSLTSNRKWLIEFLKEYKKEIDIPFKAMSHPSFIDDEVARLLKEGGCLRIQLGAQTPIEKIRHDICKRYETNETILAAVNHLKNHKIMVNIDHIFNLPTEKLEDYEEGLKFYIDLKPDRYTSFWLQYFPNTEIVNIGRAHGGIDEEALKLTRKGMISYSANTKMMKETHRELMAISRFMNWIPMLPKGVSRFILKKKWHFKMFRYKIWDKIFIIPYFIIHLFSIRNIKILFLVMKRKRLIKKAVSEADKDI